SVMTNVTTFGCVALARIRQVNISQCLQLSPFLFFSTDTATTDIYTLSLHDALPIYRGGEFFAVGDAQGEIPRFEAGEHFRVHPRSEEHTSELQLRGHLVCRLLLEKKKQFPTRGTIPSGTRALALLERLSRRLPVPPD